MNILTTIGAEGILQKYKAQFKPDKLGDGYRFFHDNYGEGVWCSRDQYTSYVNEFEAFINRSQRFMFRWTIVYFLLVFVVMGVLIIQFDVDLLDRYETLSNTVAMTLFISPLGWMFWKGNRLRKKPYEELVNINPAAANTLSMGRRHTPREILDRKLLGLSPSLIYLTPVVALVGLASSAYEYYSNGEIKPLYLLLFVSILIVYVWIIRRIRAIEAADE